MAVATDGENWIGECVRIELHIIYGEDYKLQQCQ